MNLQELVDMWKRMNPGGRYSPSSRKTLVAAAIQGLKERTPKNRRRLLKRAQRSHPVTTRDATPMDGVTSDLGLQNPESTDDHSRRVHEIRENSSHYTVENTAQNTALQFTDATSNNSLSSYEADDRALDKGMANSGAQKKPRGSLLVDKDSGHNLEREDSADKEVITREIMVDKDSALSDSAVQPVL